jgi:hypothetical protein
VWSFKLIWKDILLWIKGLKMVFGWLKPVFEYAAEALDLFTWGLENVGAVWDHIWGGVKGSFLAVKDIFMEFVTFFVNMWSAAAMRVKLVFKSIWNAVVDELKRIAGFMAFIGKILWAPIQWAFENTTDAILAVWDTVVFLLKMAIWPFVQVFNFIKEAWATTMNFFTEGIGSLLSVFDAAKSAILDALVWPFKKAVEFLDGIGLLSLFKGEMPAGDSLMGKIMSLVAGPLEILKKALNTFVIEPVNAVLAWDPPAVPGGTVGNMLGVPAVQPMAAGGVVTSPTRALVGEAGPEAVVPLDNLMKSLDNKGVIRVLNLIHGELQRMNKGGRSGGSSSKIASGEYFRND